MSEYIHADETSVTEELKQGQAYFWTGIQERDNVYINGVTGEPLDWSPDTWPGPRISLDSSTPDSDRVCLFARGRRADSSGGTGRGYHLVRQPCSSQVPCGICTIKTTTTRLMLKGLCVQDMTKDSDFDTDYYPNGLLNNRIHFKCVQQGPPYT